MNTTATGSRIVKTGGQPQIEDAGGTSAESIASGDGFLQFSVSETSTFRFLGFAHSSTWVGASGMDYSFRIQGGYVGVYERGAYKIDTTTRPGGGSGNTNGPVDALGLAQQSVAFFTKTIPQAHWNKVIWAIPNYGLYSTTQFGAPDGYATLGATLSNMGSSYSTTCPYGNGPTYDFGYACGPDPNGFDSKKGEYVFFDDLDSLADRVSVAKQAGLGGVSVGAIGNGPTTPHDREYKSLYGMIRSFYPKP